MHESRLPILVLHLKIPISFHDYTRGVQMISHEMCFYPFAGELPPHTRIHQEGRINQRCTPHAVPDIVNAAKTRFTSFIIIELYTQVGYIA